MQSSNNNGSADASNGSEPPCEAMVFFHNLWRSYDDFMISNGLPTQTMFTKETVLADFMASSDYLRGVDLEKNGPTDREDSRRMHCQNLITQTMENANKEEGTQREKAFLLSNTLQVIYSKKERDFLELLDPISNNFDRMLDITENSQFNQLNENLVDFLNQQNRTIFNHLEEYGLNPLSLKCEFVPAPSFLLFSSKLQMKKIVRSDQVMASLMTLASMLIGPNFSSIYTEAAVTTQNKLAEDLGRERMIDLYVGGAKSVETWERKKNFDMTRSVYTMNRNQLKKFSTDSCRESFIYYLTHSLLLQILQMKLKNEERILELIRGLEITTSVEFKETEDCLKKYADGEDVFLFGIPVKENYDPVDFFDSRKNVENSETGSGEEGDGGVKERLINPLTPDSEHLNKLKNLVSDWKEGGGDIFGKIISYPFYSKESPVAKENRDVKEPEDASQLSEEPGEKSGSIPSFSNVVLEKLLKYDSKKAFNDSLDTLHECAEEINHIYTKESSDLLECIHKWLFCILMVSNDRTLFENYKTNIEVITKMTGISNDEMMTKLEEIQKDLKRYMERGTRIHEDIMDVFQLMRDKEDQKPEEKDAEKVKSPFSLPSCLSLDEYYTFCYKRCGEYCDKSSNLGVCKDLLKKYKDVGHEDGEKTDGWLSSLFQLDYIGDPLMTRTYKEVHNYEINFKEMSKTSLFWTMEMLGVYPTNDKADECDFKKLDYNSIQIALYDCMLRDAKEKLVQNGGKNKPNGDIMGEKDENLIPLITNDMYMDKNGDIIEAFDIFTNEGSGVEKFNFLKNIDATNGRNFLIMRLNENIKEDIKKTHEPPHGIYSKVFRMSENLWMTRMLNAVNENYVNKSDLEKWRNYKQGFSPIFVDELKASGLTQMSPDGISTGDRDVISFKLLTDVSKLMKYIQSDESGEDEDGKEKESETGTSMVDKRMVAFPFQSYLDILMALDIDFRRKNHEINRKYGFVQSGFVYN